MMYFIAIMLYDTDIDGFIMILMLNDMIHMRMRMHILLKQHKYHSINPSDICTDNYDTSDICIIPHEYHSNHAMHMIFSILA